MNDRILRTNEGTSRFRGMGRLLAGQLAGQPLLLAEREGKPSGAFIINVKGNRIQSTKVVTCPAVLRQLRVLLGCQNSLS